MEHKIAHVMGICAALLLTAGCGRKPAAPAAPSAPAPTAVNPLVPADVAGAKLGVPQKAGPYWVTLDAAGPVKAGENRVTVRVFQDNKPATNVMVHVITSMPAMQMYGGEVMLSSAGGGRYTGTVKTATPGKWQADLTVTGGKSPGGAVYDFTVPGKPSAGS